MNNHDPDTEAIRIQATKLADQGQLQDARELLMSIMDTCQDKVLFWLTLADVDEDAGDHHAAAASFEKAVALRPNDVRCSKYLFHSYWRLAKDGEPGAAGKALEELGRFLVVDPSSEWHLQMQRDVRWLMKRRG